MLKTFKRNLFNLSLVGAIAATFNYGSVAFASSPGTVPFGFFKAVQQVFMSIGGYLGASNAWVSGRTFASGTSDGTFSAPVSIAYDSVHQVVYVLDYYRIEKINAVTGALIGAVGALTASTGTCPSSGVAPGWCTGGSFTSGSGDGAYSTSYSIAYDSTNDALYLSDTFNSRVVKITASTGAFVGAVGLLSSSTGTCPSSGVATGWCTGGIFAGSQSDGGFFGHRGIAYDSVNNAIYVVNSIADQVAKLTATTGAWVGAIGNLSSSTGTCPSSGAAPGWCTGGTFTSGTGNGMFAGPASVTYDSTNNALYITDGNRVDKVAATTGAYVGSIGGLSGTSTGTCPSSGVAAGWCTGGVFLSSAGNGVFYAAYAITYDSTNNAIYILDGGDLNKVTATTGAYVGSVGSLTASTGTCPSSGAATGWCTGGTFATGSGNGMFGGSNTGLAYDSTNNAIYVADDANFRLVKLTATTGAFYGAVGNSPNPVSSWSTLALSSGGNTDGLLSGPYATAYDSTNNAAYIADSTNNRIVKISGSTGAFVGAIGKLTATVGTCPSSGAATGWCTGGTFTSGTGNGMFNNPTGVAYDSTNNAIYVADSGNNRIVKLTATTGAFVGAIGKVSTIGGTCTATGAAPGWCAGGVFATGTGDGMFKAPASVAYDSTNNALYITDTTNNRIVKATATTGANVGAIGKVSTIGGTCTATGAAPGWCAGGVFATGTGDGMFQAPSAITYDSTNNAIYIADSTNNRVVKATATTGANVGAIGKVTTTGGTCTATGAAPGWCAGGVFGAAATDGTLSAPSGVSYDSSRNALYISDTTNNRLVKVSATSGAFVGAIGNLSASSGTCPASGAATSWCTGGTFATGTAPGTFSGPRGTSLTGSNMYISDTGNNRVVRKSLP